MSTPTPTLATADSSFDARYALLDQTPPTQGPSQAPSHGHYLARHLTLNRMTRLTAIPAPPASASTPMGAGALRDSPFWECVEQALALRHMALPRLYDLFQRGETLYLVSEVVEGVSLAERFAERGRLPLREALALALQLCEALDTLAREAPRLLPLTTLTPESLVLTAGGEIALGEFAPARWLADAPMPVADAPGASLPYLAPELRAATAGAPVDARADLYSVAALLYRALSGLAPVAGAERPALDTLAPLAPRALCAVIERALNADPEARYPDAAAFGAALARVVCEALPGLVTTEPVPYTRVADTALAASATRTGLDFAGASLTHTAVTLPIRRGHSLGRISGRALAAISLAWQRTTRIGA